MLQWFPKFTGKVNEAAEARRSRALELACFKKLYLTRGRWKRDELFYFRCLMSFSIEFRASPEKIAIVELTSDQNSAEFDLMETLPEKGVCSGYIDSVNPVDGSLRLSGDDCTLENDPLYFCQNKSSDLDVGFVLWTATKGLFVTCKWSRQTIMKMRFLGSFKIDLTKPTRSNK